MIEAFATKQMCSERRFLFCVPTATMSPKNYRTTNKAGVGAGARFTPDRFRCSEATVGSRGTGDPSRAQKINNQLFHGERVIGRDAHDLCFNPAHRTWFEVMPRGGVPRGGGASISLQP